MSPKEAKPHGILERLGASLEARANRVPEDRFGYVFALVLIAIMSSAFLGKGAIPGTLMLLAESVAVVFALRTSRAKRKLLAVGSIVTLVALLGALAALLTGDDKIASAAYAFMTLVLILIVPYAIAARIGQHPKITLQTVLGALTIYLIIGLFFATIYATIGDLAGQPFFAQGPQAGQEFADYIYFSFVTMATVGYGDLTAAATFSRLLAVTEAVLGQLYLVTVVALLVGNLGRERRPIRRTGANGDLETEIESLDERVQPDTTPDTETDA